MGYENLRKPHIQEAIQKLRKELALKENIVTPEEVMEGYTRAIRYDPRKLYGSDGSLLPVDELDDDTALELVGFEVIETVLKNSSDDDEQIVKRIHKYKLPDKRANRADVKKVFGMDAPEKKDHTGEILLTTDTMDRKALAEAIKKGKKPDV